MPSFLGKDIIWGYENSQNWGKIYRYEMLN